MGTLNPTHSLASGDNDVGVKGKLIPCQHWWHRVAHAASWAALVAVSRSGLSRPMCGRRTRPPHDANLPVFGRSSAIVHEPLTWWSRKRLRWRSDSTIMHAAHGVLLSYTLTLLFQFFFTLLVFFSSVFSSACVCILD